MADAADKPEEASGLDKAPGRAQADDGSSSGSSSDSDSSSDSGSSSSSSGSDSDSSSGSDSDSGSSASGSPKRKVLGKKALLKGAKKRQLRPKRVVKRKRFDEDDASRPKKKSGEESDEYDSEKEVKETADDRAFIDDDDDDRDLLREYQRERQDFDDEAPSRRKRRGGVDSEDISGVKRTKSGKRMELSDEQKRDMVQKVLRTMREAAAQDVADKKAGKPSVAKLRALPEVRTAVANKALWEGLMNDDGSTGGDTILLQFRDWLRPLPGSDLPNLQMREAVYDMLVRLQHSIDPEAHLRPSRLGEVLFVLSQHPKETAANQAKLKGLIDTFSRRIFAKSAVYKDNMQNMLDTQEALGLVSNPPPKKASAGASASAGAGAGSSAKPADADELLPGDDAAMETLLGGAGAAIGAGAGEAAAPAAPVLAKDLPRHARIPKALVFDYTRRPGAQELQASQKAQLGAGASGLSKKMVEDKRKKRMGLLRGMKISIEGRGSDV